MFEPSPDSGHLEEYENFIYEWGEEVRSNVIAYLQGTGDMDLFDNAVLTCTGGFCSIDMPIDTYAASFLVEAPAADRRVVVEVVGYTDENVETYVGLLGKIRSYHDDKRLLDTGHSDRTRDVSHTCYEILNLLAAQFIHAILVGGSIYDGLKRK